MIILNDTGEDWGIHYASCDGLKKVTDKIHKHTVIEFDTKIPVNKLFIKVWKDCLLVSEIDERTILAQKSEVKE